MITKSLISNRELFNLFNLFQPFNTLAHPMKEAKKANYKFESKVLDINNIDVSILSL